MDRTTAGLGAAPSNKVSSPSTYFDIVLEALSHANSVASQCVALADELLGCEPTPTSCATDQPSPSGVLPGMADAARHTRGRLGDAVAALERIQRALP